MEVRSGCEKSRTKLSRNQKVKPVGTFSMLDYREDLCRNKVVKETLKVYWISAI